MSIRTILQGDIPELREVSIEVIDFSEALFTILDDLIDTLNHNRGLALAAPQIGILLRTIVVDVGEGVVELVNPVITRQEGLQVNYESCLSSPDLPLEIPRPQSVTVHAVNRVGSPIVIEASGLLARVLCHEVDHLNGVLFTDHLSDDEVFRQLLFQSMASSEGDMLEDVVRSDLRDGMQSGNPVALQDAEMALDMVADLAWKLSLIVELLKDSREFLGINNDFSLFESMTDELEHLFEVLEAKLDALIQT